jgi:trigger factor
MTEMTCRRELDLEVPAEEVQKAVARVAKEFSRVARVPGFRPGKAPISLIRRRFADDIKGEVLQSLLPDRIKEAFKAQNLMPITEPHVDKVDFEENGPLKFRAIFEVLPEFELGTYKDLDVEIQSAAVTDEEVEKTIQDSRERSATFIPVEGRPLAKGDFAQLKLTGTPADGGEPLKADNVMAQLGAEDTLQTFTDNLVGASVGEERRFDVNYPEDYPDKKLAGKLYSYVAEVVGIKEKKLPELDDEFVKAVSDVATLDELRAKIRQGLEKDREQRRNAAIRDAILAKIVASHDFPVPEALVENQMNTRLDRAVRMLAAQGVDPRAVSVDWDAMRQRQRDPAVDDVKAELLLDRIATAENIEASEEDLEHEIEHMAQHSGESSAAVRASLTKQGALDRIKSKLRSEKTLEWLQKNTRVTIKEPERS